MKMEPSIIPTSVENKQSVIPAKKDVLNESIKTGEDLFEKYELKTGKGVRLKKIEIFGKSSVPVGTEVSGSLLADAKKGSPIRIEKGNTANVDDIFEQDGKLLIRTETSIYEIFPSDSVIAEETESDKNTDEKVEFQEYVRQAEIENLEKLAFVRAKLQGGDSVVDKIPELPGSEINILENEDKSEDKAQQMQINPEDAVGLSEKISGEELIEKLDLRKGKSISLVKRSVSGNSAIGVGQRLDGKILRDVSIGNMITLESGNTSPIEDITEEQGRYLVKTRTSVYELFVEENEAENAEKNPSLMESLQRIEANILAQPQSIQDMFREKKGEFCQLKIIDGKEFIFSQPNGDSVLALVKDHDDVYKTRHFRFSQSDHQWKSMPGLRNNGSFMKGEEKNPLHNYVQSAKLHKDIYAAISGLPQGKNDSSGKEYLPIAPNDGEGGRYWEEFTFKEKYRSLKNQEWASYQDFSQRFLKVYETFVLSSSAFKNLTLDGSLYKWAQKFETMEEFRNIKEELERINENLQLRSELEKCSLQEIENSDKPEMKRLAETYKKNVGSYIEKSFAENFPQTMIPDFSEGKCVDRYEKKEMNGGEGGTIHIEEYKISNEDNDELVFAMAYDDEGRVYIDNIYDPRVGVNDYGIPEEIVQMGHLVYKPEDYKNQTYPIPKKYLKDANNGYVDVSALWENIPVIRKYKEELLARGVLG